MALCHTYGAGYNPSRESLQINALNALYTEARNRLAQVNTAKSALTHAVNHRQTAYAPLKKLCTRIINALAACGASGKLVEDARTINRKIQGKRSRPIAPGEENHISVSRQSYDSLAENFSQLLTLVSAEPRYTPNETELQPERLQTFLESLGNANTGVRNAYTGYSNALIARNQLLYEAPDGLVPVALDVKKYVKSLYGSASAQYKHLNKIKFRKC